MELAYYLLFWVCIFGLCFGSFYNVVILRSLSGESIVFPPSKCPKCQHKLYFWHNIPVLSYIILRGKCYFCKEKISIQYPIVEITTMILFALSYIKFGISVTTLFIIFWLSCLLIMTATDLKEKIVDCNFAIAMCISGIIHSYILAKWYGVLFSVLGIIAGALVFIIIGKIGKFILKKDVLGEADAYVSAALGGIFGIFNLPKVLIIGLFAYGTIVIPKFLFDRFKQKDYPTCISAGLFFISLALFAFLNANYYTFSAIVLTGICFVYYMFKGKNNNIESSVPYVPAFGLGTVIFILLFL